MGVYTCLVPGFLLVAAGVWYLLDARRQSRGLPSRWPVASGGSARRARWLGLAMTSFGALTIVATVSLVLYAFSLTRGLGAAKAGTQIALYNGATFVVPAGWEASWFDSRSPTGRQFLTPPALSGGRQLPTPVQELDLTSLANDGTSMVTVTIYASDEDLEQELGTIAAIRARSASSTMTAVDLRPTRVQAGSDTSASARVTTSPPDPDGETTPFALDMLIQKPGHGPMRITASLPLGTSETGPSTDPAEMAAHVLRFIGYQF